jgi:hypothetical protein
MTNASIDRTQSNNSKKQQTVQINDELLLEEKKRKAVTYSRVWQNLQHMSLCVIKTSENLFKKKNSFKQLFLVG